MVDVRVDYQRIKGPGGSCRWPSLAQGQFAQLRQMSISGGVRSGGPNNIRLMQHLGVLVCSSPMKISETYFVEQFVS